jgi:hypothetical protein
MINSDYFQNSVNRSISILENHHACCDVGTESLNADKMNLILDFHPKNKLERDQSQINMHFQKQRRPPGVVYLNAGQLATS